MDRPRRRGGLVRTRDELKAAWPRLRGCVVDALAYTGGAYDAEYVLAELLAGLEGRSAMNLWVGERSAIVTQIVDYPGWRACRFFLAGGDLDELREMEAEVIAAARGLGCAKVEIAGRRGWLRALDGYEETCVVMMKDIEA